MTKKEEALLEVMNSKELSDESKLYIVQHLTDDGYLVVPTKATSKSDDVELPDITPRLCNPDAHITTYNQLGLDLQGKSE